MNRREFLTVAGATVPVAISGCQTGDEGPGPDDIERRQQLGTAPQLPFTAAPEREYEYLPEQDSVRTSTGTMPFDEWGTRRATHRALERVRADLQRSDFSLDGVRFESGVSDLDSVDFGDSTRTVTESDFDRAIEIGPLVTHHYLFSREGDLRREPDVAFETLVSETPWAARVTMSFPEQEYTAMLPVICRVRVAQET